MVTIVLIVSDGRSNPWIAHYYLNISMRPNMNLNTFFFSVGPILYDLYAICNHAGTVNMGHYTACCLDENGWCFYNDSR